MIEMPVINPGSPTTSASQSSLYESSLYELLEGESNESGGKARESTVHVMDEWQEKDYTPHEAKAEVPCIKAYLPPEESKES